MGLFGFETDEGIEWAANAYRNATEGLDPHGRPFSTFEGPNGTIVDVDGNELPKDRYGEYIFPK